MHASMQEPMHKLVADQVWQYAHPFIRAWQITPEHIDHYQHVNNVAYVSQLETLAWQHSNALGLSIEQYQALDRAMVISKHVLNYVAPSHLDDSLLCATWIISTDNKYKLSRAFQFIHAESHKTIFTATTDFVCCSLSSGMPKRMPEPFKLAYGQACVNSI